LYQIITDALGYRGSSLFCENDGTNLIAPSERHWLRAAREAGARGSYFFRTSPSPGALRPAVHVAEAQTSEEARAVHRRLWNQGINPFLLVVLPSEVRVFSGFAYNPQEPAVGQIFAPLSLEQKTISRIIKVLDSFNSRSIDSGSIWKSQERHLGADQRVDTTLLAHLTTLSGILQSRHDLNAKTSHALIGKFVYISYLRARDILSDKWLQDEAQLRPHAIFADDAFSPNITLQSFRALTISVEERFNGQLFPIPWGSRFAPRSDAIRAVARVFAGDDILSGQLHLPFTAYDFSYIPVEFLSSIYEEFLHAEEEEEKSNFSTKANKDIFDQEKQGAHYTPEPLADYLVSEVNSVRPLNNGMKILDPCCGSGVFLVVAFRRLVELERDRRKCESLDADDLKDLLESSIYGVERNVTACQIAGFSLILALLSYVDPPELHTRREFRFPALIGRNIFPADFFDQSSDFWQKVSATAGKGLVFDWIIGNPPWVELDARNSKARFALDWLRGHSEEYGFARARSGEAFSWRVMDCLAPGGTVGLILHAKSLTNDHLVSWRRKFFGGVQVHRVTNFSNLAYVMFASSQQPAAAIVYGRKDSTSKPFLVHIGPFVASQHSLVARKGMKRRAWALGFMESETKFVSMAQAAKGEASTWKFALWGNQRDKWAIERLRKHFPKSLGELAAARGWSIDLGLQLRADDGSGQDPNVYVKDLNGLRVLDHKALLEFGARLTIRGSFLRDNPFGCYVRKKGGYRGLNLIRGPRLFLWHDFAAYSQEEFIFRHDKVGLAGGTEREMKAAAVVWNSSYLRYLLFFVSSAAWGIANSQIDKGDAERLPFPELCSELEDQLADVWAEALDLEEAGTPFSGVREFFDKRVSLFLDIPETVSTVVRDFFRVRYQMNKGKSPDFLRLAPAEREMSLYAARLRNELDMFLGGRGRHQVTVLHSGQGAVVSVALVSPGVEIDPRVRAADGAEKEFLRSLLQAAESELNQWAYVRRSIRIFDGSTIHIIKPPRCLEWTETQALLDADDIIAEIIEAQSS
jgi:hypothetical protein